MDALMKCHKPVLAASSPQDMALWMPMAGGTVAPGASAAAGGAQAGSGHVVGKD